jgi:hypothetical protein
MVGICGGVGRWRERSACYPMRCAAYGWGDPFFGDARDVGGA